MESVTTNKRQVGGHKAQGVVILPALTTNIFEATLIKQRSQQERKYAQLKSLFLEITTINK